MCKILEILGQHPQRNDMSKLTTFDPIFQLTHSAIWHHYIFSFFFFFFLQHYHYHFALYLTPPRDIQSHPIQFQNHSATSIHFDHHNHIISIRQSLKCKSTYLCFNEDALEGVERERRRIERRKRGRDAEEIPEVRIG